MGSLEKELLLACFRGDVDGVKYYLDQGANMNVICPTGRTPFGAAAQVGNIEILQLFLESSSRKCRKTKLRSSTRQKLGSESSVRKKTSQKNNKSNLGYFVCVHNEQGSLMNYSVNQNKNTDSNESQNGNSDLHKEIKELPTKRLEEEKKLVLTTISKTAYNLATSNDSFVRRDPRFESKSMGNDLELSSWEDGELTPDGMDKLEWDMEVEEKNLPFDSQILPSDMGDPWYALYRWYNDLMSQSSSCLKEKPSPNDIDLEDQFGCRALHYATIEGHVEAVKLLINAGCKVNVGDSDNLTPLHMAAAKDSPEIVKLLIAAGANVHHKTTDRISPLHVSASRGLLSNVKLLVKAGSHIDTLDSSDRTPLFMAVSRSHQDVVAYLLEQGAKVNLEEIHGYTPLYEAVWQKNTTIVKMLLNAGAKITQSHHLLHYAVLHRHKEMVSLLISAGSVINLRDENGDTPLIVAAKTHQTDIARLLLMNGASINCTSYITGNTPLHEVICNISGGSHKFEEMFALFQEYGVDVEAKSDSGCTGLWLAVQRRFDDAAATLIRHGADVNHHMDIFSHVLRRGNKFLAELLICAGYRFRNVQLLGEASTPLERWLTQLKVNPMRLCDLCRIKIRAQFKAKVYEKVSRLVLPSAIKVFLKLEDIVCDSD